MASKYLKVSTKNRKEQSTSPTHKEVEGMLQQQLLQTDEKLS